MTRIGTNGRTRLPPLLFAAAPFVVVGCGDGAVEPPPPPTPVPATLTISPASAALQSLGETTQLTAEVRDQNGQTMTNAAVAWTSSDASVATVVASGLVTAVKNGTATVTATAGSASGTAAVTVDQLVATVAVVPAADTLLAFGDTLRLAASAFDGNGHMIDATEFEWSSSDVSVARVDASGLVTALSEGRTTVTAIAGDVQGTAEIRVENLDRAALVALYNATDGPNWLDSENWLTDAPLGEWHGVTTASEGRVTSLFFWSNNLRGTIPPELGMLKDLTFLNIGANALTGPIPVELGDIAQLEEAYFQFNDLSGSIPEALGGLQRLRKLGLNHNGFTGAVPENVLRLPRLEFLNLSANDLAGVIDWNLEWRSHLTEMRIDQTDLCMVARRSLDPWLASIRFRGDRCSVEETGRHALESLFEAAGGTNWRQNANWATAAPLDTWFGVSAIADVVNAVELGDNGLSGPIPREITALARLSSLDLSGNRLEGGLPAQASDLVSLKRLRVNDNGLVGPLPMELTALSLRRLDYSNTGVCTPANSEMQTWLAGIDSLDTSATRCESVSVSVSAVPGNGGLAEGGGEWERAPGTTVTTTLSAGANPGYDFDGWIDDGDTLSTNPVHVMQVSSDHAVAAHFSVNQERGKWAPGGTYTWYDFQAGDYGIDSLSWTFLPAVDPPQSLADKGLLHYYAMNFGVTNSTAAVGRGYAGLQTNGLINGKQRGKAVNFSIWGSDDARTNGLLNENNTECKCHQIMYVFPWEEGRAYRFVLKPGPSGTDDGGKWWGLWVTDPSTGGATFIGEQRVPRVIQGLPSAALSPRGIHVFGEDLYWWRALPGTRKYVCSDFEPSSVAVIDVRADDREPIGILNTTNSGKTFTYPSNGYATVSCHATVIDGGQGDVQHNLGFWPEPPNSVVGRAAGVTADPSPP